MEVALIASANSARAPSTVVAVILPSSSTIDTSAAAPLLATAANEPSKAVKSVATFPI